MNLSHEEKIERAKNLKEEFGLNRTLSAVGIAKSTWYYYQNRKVDYAQKYSPVKEPLLKSIEENPGYGWRKLQDELSEVHGVVLNHKPLKNLLNLWELSLPRTVKKPCKNRILKLIQEVGDKANLLRGLNMDDIEPFKVLLTDFTWIYYHGGAKRAALIAYEDLAGKMIYGHSMGMTQDTGLALEAWDIAKKRFRELGGDTRGIILHQDQDPVFTGHEYVSQMVLKDGVRLSYSRSGTPGDNAAKESFIGHFKMENKSLFLGAKKFHELKEIVKSRMKYYTDKRRHQTLGNIAPLRHLENWKRGL